MSPLHSATYALPVFSTTTVIAQATPPPPAPSMTSAKSYTFEWVIVGVCVAAALFAVCRPSRRT